MFWKLFRNSDGSDSHAPIKQLLSTRRHNLDLFVKSLVEDAQKRENGIAQLIEEIIFDCDPFVMRYILSGCHGTMDTISRVPSSECAKLSPWKPSDMDGVLRKCLATAAPQQKFRTDFHLNFNIWMAMGVEGTKQPEFAAELMKKYGAYFDSVDDLKYLIDYNVPLTHPDLLANCIAAGNLEICNCVLSRGAPLGNVQTYDIPAPKTMYEFASFSTLVLHVLQKGGDIEAKDMFGRTLLHKVQPQLYDVSHVVQPVPADPVEKLKDLTHQRLRFLMQLISKGATWKPNLSLVYFAIVAGGGISEIRTLLSMAGKGLDGTEIWMDLLTAKPTTKNIPDIAIGLICDLLIEFKASIVSIHEHYEDLSLVERPKVLLKILRVLLSSPEYFNDLDPESLPSTDGGIELIKFEVFRAVAAIGLGCVAKIARIDRVRAEEIGVAVCQLKAAPDSENPIVREESFQAYATEELPGSISKLVTAGLLIVNTMIPMEPSVKLNDSAPKSPRSSTSSTAPKNTTDNIWTVDTTPSPFSSPVASSFGSTDGQPSPFAPKSPFSPSATASAPLVLNPFGEAAPTALESVTFNLQPSAVANPFASPPSSPAANGTALIESPFGSAPSNQFVDAVGASSSTEQSGFVAGLFSSVGPNTKRAPAKWSKKK